MWPGCGLGQASVRGRRRQAYSLVHDLNHLLCQPFERVIEDAYPRIDGSQAWVGVLHDFERASPLKLGDCAAGLGKSGWNAWASPSTAAIWPIACQMLQGLGARAVHCRGAGCGSLANEDGGTTRAGSPPSRRWLTDWNARHLERRASEPLGLCGAGVARHAAAAAQRGPHCLWCHKVAAAAQCQ
jgi:hypothetical protein